MWPRTMYEYVNIVPETKTINCYITGAIYFRIDKNNIKNILSRFTYYCLHIPTSWISKGFEQESNTCFFIYGLFTSRLKIFGKQHRDTFGNISSRVVIKVLYQNLMCSSCHTLREQMVRRSHYTNKYKRVSTTKYKRQTSQIGLP